MTKIIKGEMTMYDTYSYNYGYSHPSTYSYSTPSTTSADGILGVLATIGVTFWLITFAIILVQIIGRWKMYKKAGVDGWESLIAGHNIVVEFQLAGIPTYWYFLLFIPIANICVMIWKDIELAKSFGRSTGFGIGLFFLPFIFYPILGFSKAEYIGPHYNVTPAQPQQPAAPVAPVQPQAPITPVAPVEPQQPKNGDNQ